MNLEVQIPGDQVIDFLKAHGATWTDATSSFPGGRHFDNIERYRELLQTGMWEVTKRPIYLDARSGQVWQGTDRTAAIALVDWSKVPVIPEFTIIVEHPVSP